MKRKKINKTTTTIHKQKQHKTRLTLINGNMDKLYMNTKRVNQFYV